MHAQDSSLPADGLYTDESQAVLILSATPTPTATAMEVLQQKTANALADIQRRTCRRSTCSILNLAGAR
jgi:hypothetical protein